MRKLLLKSLALILNAAIVISIFAGLMSKSVSAEDDVPLNSTTFPDEYFRNFADSLDDNDDGILSYNERRFLNYLNLPGDYDEITGTITPVCSDFTGIEYFPNLTYMNCTNNNLTSLDVSHNPTLVTLNCDNNNLTSLDLSNNPDLVTLSCNNNSLQSLDLTNLANLESLYCSYNNLTSLDLSNKPRLWDLACSNNNLGSIDLSGLESLEFLCCSEANLTNLDLSNNPYLYYIECFNNNLEELDVSNLEYLESLYCSYNNLTSLDLSNNTYLTYLDCANNNLSSLVLYDIENLVVFINDGNPQLTQYLQIRSFIERLYLVALGRSEVDEEGLQNWMNQLRAHVENGGATARFFCTCQEMVNRNLSDEDYVEMLYNVFFDRASDATGKADWVGRLSRGASRESIIDGFVNSIEWANICASYNIESGGTAQSNIPATEEINSFVERLYSMCLRRGSDSGGLDKWGREIVNRRMTATEVAYGFFFSEEFIGFGLNDEEYLERLYHTFIEREPDASGKAYWLERLENGTSREEVFFGFAYSEEFADICESFGIYN